MKKKKLPDVSVKNFYIVVFNLNEKWNPKHVKKQCTYLNNDKELVEYIDPYSLQGILLIPYSYRHFSPNLSFVGYKRGPLP